MALEQEGARAGARRIYAEVAGGAITGDAHHITMPAPGGSGAALAMRRALQYSGVSPDDIDYICAHAFRHAAQRRHRDGGDQGGVRRAGVSGRGQFAQIDGRPCSALPGPCRHWCVRWPARRVPPTINLDTPDPACGPRLRAARAGLCRWARP
ncbi:MAG: hypothetical protein U0531_14460 [Dehalococcoidia bacterium]